MNETQTACTGSGDLISVKSSSGLRSCGGKSRGPGVSSSLLGEYSKSDLMRSDTSVGEGV